MKEVLYAPAEPHWRTGGDTDIPPPPPLSPTNTDTLQGTGCVGTTLIFILFTQPPAKLPPQGQSGAALRPRKTLTLRITSLNTRVESFQCVGKKKKMWKKCGNTHLNTHLESGHFIHATQSQSETQTQLLRALQIRPESIMFICF